MPKGRCFVVTCNDAANSIDIKVGSVIVTCIIPGAKMTVAGYEGNIICPENFDLFCNGYKVCQCGQNGICIAGECKCAYGYGGPNCTVITCHDHCQTQKCTGSGINECKKSFKFLN